MHMLACQYLFSYPFPIEGLAHWLTPSPCSSGKDGCEIGAETACRASFVMALLSRLDLPGRIVMAVSLSYILGIVSFLHSRSNIRPLKRFSHRMLLRRRIQHGLPARRDLTAEHPAADKVGKP
jgi:hypothetical protein